MVREAEFFGNEGQQEKNDGTPTLYTQPTDGLHSELSSGKATDQRGKSTTGQRKSHHAAYDGISMLLPVPAHGLNSSCYARKSGAVGFRPKFTSLIHGNETREWSDSGN